MISLQFLVPDLTEKQYVFKSGQRIAAGFPSPAQDMPAEGIDLNKELIRHPATTFCVRVCGNSMKDCAIDDGDLLIVDRSLLPHDGNIAVCFIDGEFTLKRIAVRPEGLFLVPANAAYPAIPVREESDFQVWGVVTYVVKHVKG